MMMVVHPCFQMSLLHCLGNSLPPAAEQQQQMCLQGLVKQLAGYLLMLLQVSAHQCLLQSLLMPPAAAGWRGLLPGQQSRQLDMQWRRLG
jgi:hypothetical protein